MTSPAENLEVVRPEHSAAFVQVSRTWQRRQHFSLVLATCNNPEYRDALIGQLNAMAPGARIDLQPADTPLIWLKNLEQVGTQGVHRVHICLPLDHAWPVTWWEQANLLRERLADALPRPLIVWLSEADVNACATHAADLWNWRDGVVSFTINESALWPIAIHRPEALPLVGKDAEALKVRAAHIEAYLHTAATDDPAAGELLLEAVLIYEQLGVWDRAQQCANEAQARFEFLGNALMAGQAVALRASLEFELGNPELALKLLRYEALPVFQRLNNRRWVAVTQGRIADVLMAQGQIGEALRIRQEQELPVYEELGDVRSLAVTLGQIADVLREQGKFDEALSVLRSGVLKAFQRLGDVRLLAVAQAKIADVLMVQGQLNEALNLLEGDVLTSFEMLGDVRSQAVTKGKIAEILMARGQYDEALKIRQEQELPVYEKLGDIRSQSICRVNIALLLAKKELASQAIPLLQSALTDARLMGLAEADRIADLLAQFERAARPT